MSCLDCKHWDEAEGPPDVAGSEYRGKGIITGRWGTCERIQRYGDSAHEEDQGSRGGRGGT